LLTRRAVTLEPSGASPAHAWRVPLGEGSDRPAALGRLKLRAAASRLEG
jgi:hypothetical protein